MKWLDFIGKRNIFPHRNKTKTEKTIKITAELLNGLEKACNIKELISKEEFIDVLKLNKAIIYMLVDWSGPELASRYSVYQSIIELGPNGTPVFKIDCSDQTKQYIVDWLIEQRASDKDFYCGGWGETLYLNNGNIIDFIKYPAHIGRVKTKEKLAEWKRS